MGSLRLSACSLNGAQRRLLRSEAGRRQSTGVLAMLELSVPVESEGEEEWARLHADEMSKLLETEELVRVRLRGAQKRRRAAALGAILAEAAGGQIAQSLGHTVLVYRARETNGLLESTEEGTNE